MAGRAAVAVLLALALAAPAARADDDDEPELLGKKLSEWLTLLETGKTAKERRRGVIAAEKIGHSASRKVVPALVKALQNDKEEEVRAAAARGTGRAVAKAFADAREDKADELPRMADARNALTAAMRTDKSDMVREAAAAALGDIGLDARAAAGALGTVLKDKNPAIVRAAAASIRRMAKEAKDAQNDLVALLTNAKGDPDARVDAAVSLGLLRYEIGAAVPPLKAAAADAKNELRLRRAAVEAIGKLGKEAASACDVLGALIAGEKSPDELRVAAAEALEQFGGEAKPAIPSLIKAVGDSERVVRCLAMQSLSRMGKDLDSQRKEAVTAILKAVDDLSVEVRVAALETLGALAEEGYGGEAENVVKVIDRVIRAEGRKEVVAAAKLARAKIRPPKK